MKQVLNLLVYYVSYTRFISWLSALGALLVCLSLIFSIFNTGFAFATAIWGTILLYGLPAFVLFIPFRELISMERMALVPNLKFKAGVALLVFTLAGSLYLPFFVAMNGIDINIIKLAFNIYIVSCLYQYFVQKCLASRYFLFLITGLPVLMVIPVFYFGSIIAPFIYKPAIMTTVFLFSLATWFIFLKTLQQKPVFNPIMKNFHGSANNSGDPFQNPWPKTEKLNRIFSFAGTILSGQPDGRLALLSRALFVVYVIPFLGACLMSVLSIFNEKSLFSGAVFLETLVTIYIGLSALIVAFLPVFYSEFAPRSRLLWLRHGSDRLTHWRHLESLMWRTQTWVFSFVLLNSVFLAIFSQYHLEIVLNYPVIIIIMALFNAYFGLYSRIAGWPQFARVLFTMLMNIVIFSAISRIGQTESFGNASYIMEILLIILIVIFRLKARNDFSSIDWMQVKLLRPRRLA